jgi:hypothetical protein
MSQRAERERGVAGAGWGPSASQEMMTELPPYGVSVFFFPSFHTSYVGSTSRPRMYFSYQSP